jgi:hypothetical protein
MRRHGFVRLIDRRLVQMFDRATLFEALGRQ